MFGTRTVLLFTACMLLPVLFTFGLGLALHWRVLARHVIPLAALFSLLYAFGLAWWWRHRLPGRAAAVISAMIMVHASVNVRYAPRHAKDDYKHAAELAVLELARDGRVWWVADPQGAYYYGVVNDQPERQKARDNQRVSVAEDSAFPLVPGQEPPSLVLLSKPETYDQQNLVGNYLAANKYRLIASFPAFTAWAP